VTTAYLLARNPTDSVTDGFLPAARRLGLDVVLLTDDAEAHRRAYAGIASPPAAVLPCQVTEPGAVIEAISSLDPPGAVLSNSDHLQTPAALAAEYFGLPGKDWRATLRCKNKALMRSVIAQAGLDPVRVLPLGPDDDPALVRGAGLPFPCVLKPREGVASEDVVLVADLAELRREVARIRARRPGATLLVEEFLDGSLHTLETLGDGRELRVLGGFRTDLSEPPHFAEERMIWWPEPRDAVLASVLDQLQVLGVGLGACHTEYVVQGDRARLIEVNYRAVGDHADFLLAEALGEPYFELVLRAHLGEPVASLHQLSLHPAAAGCARVDYVYARSSGELDAIPAAADVEERDGARLRYRPWRRRGDRITLSGSNRDIIGAIRALGPSPERTSALVSSFLAGHTWLVHGGRVDGGRVDGEPATG
jgi:biotin carboxylase